MAQFMTPMVGLHVVMRNKSKENVCSDFLWEVVSVMQMRHAGGSFSAKIPSVTTVEGVNLDRRKGLSRVTEFMNGPLQRIRAHYVFIHSFTKTASFLSCVVRNAARIYLASYLRHRLSL